MKKLVTLCDQSPATPFDIVQYVLEKEFGRSVGEIFEKFDVYPLGSASIAQVFNLCESKQVLISFSFS